MFIIKNNGTVFKSHQSAVPFEFTAIYFVLPFIIGVFITWVLYAAIRFIATGFRG